MLVGDGQGMLVGDGQGMLVGDGQGMLVGDGAFPWHSLTNLRWDSDRWYEVLG
jgi:hypothetical protein